jgi:N-acylglucosamine 2-epimerase
MLQSGVEFKSLLDFYKRHLVDVILPFWRRAIDKEHGGIFTCFDNTGSGLVSTDKYTWSQGRFVWVWARIANMCQRRLLDGEADEYLSHAGKTVNFLRRNVIMENGHCAFLLTETGEKKESIAGEGYDTSYFADCFVILGFTEYARVTKDGEIFAEALALYDNLNGRLKSGNVRSEPYPIPAGFRAHSMPMIMLNVTQELSAAAKTLGHERVRELEEASVRYMTEIMENFYFEEGKIAEIRLPEGADANTVFARHLNPGHAIECMWFIIKTAERTGNRDFLAKACRAIKTMFKLGWDDDYGGLFRFIDREGGKPRGDISGSAFERLILDTWDTKLWWPHSEALYSNLRGYELTCDDDFHTLYDMAHEYTFRTFPNDDKKVGEWIQIRDRIGKPIQKVVALPVKDPYHIMRNILLIIELLSQVRLPF